MNGSDAAIVLGGGRATRLGGADKASIVVDGRMLVDHVYRALHFCTPLVAVGPSSLARPSISVVREDPPLTGPVAAIAAGIDGIRSALPHPDAALPESPLPDFVWVFSCDLPRAADVVALLADEPLDGADVLVPVDEDGRQQWLAARYRTQALSDAVRRLDPAGASMRDLVRSLRIRTLPDRDRASLDLDTWEAIDHYRGNA